MENPEKPALPAEKPASAEGEFETIIFDSPIKRGDSEIASIQLRKPKAGEMRGLQLQSVVQADVISMITLVPRISIPPILPQEVENLGAEDFGAIAGVVMGFFMSKADRAEMARVLGLTDPKEPPKS